MSQRLVLIDEPEGMLLVVKLKYKIDCGGIYVGCRLTTKLGLCDVNYAIFLFYSQVSKLKAT